MQTLCQKHWAEAKKLWERKSAGEKAQIMMYVAKAIWSTADAWRAGNAPAPNCLYCQEALDVHGHHLWQCPAWAPERVCAADVVGAYPSDFAQAHGLSHDAALQCLPHATVSYTHLTLPATLRVSVIGVSP